MTEISNDEKVADQPVERTEWTTEQLLEDFQVQGFGGYCVCVVRRRSDNQLGSVLFDGSEHPRIYRTFTAHTS